MMKNSFKIFRIKAIPGGNSGPCLSGESGESIPGNPPGGKPAGGGIPDKTIPLFLTNYNDGKQAQIWSEKTNYF